MRLWAARLDRPQTGEEAAALTAALPARRRARLVRSRPVVRREPLCAYGLLRLALRTELGWEDFPEMDWTERGKPFFPAFPEVRFSLSHTAGAVLAGISVRPLGVDIQIRRPVRVSVMEKLAGTRDEAAFFRWWVRREAAAKWSGAGLSGVLRRPELPADVRYWPLETFPGYFAGVCADPGETPLLRRCPLEALVRGGELRI